MGRDAGSDRSMHPPAGPARGEGVSAAPPSTSLGEIARLFLKLGTIAFGGPAAHVAMMEDEVVHRRRWLTREQFLDYLGATNLIPGPNSTELAIHIGHARAGWPGLLVAGTCFILPATLIVAAIAWAYVRFGALPQVTTILLGIKPVVISVVVQAIWRLARSALRTRWLAALGVGALTAAALGVNELAVLFGAGTVAALVRIVRAAADHGQPPGAQSAHALAAGPLLASAGGAAAAGGTVGAAGAAGAAGAVGAAAAGAPVALWPLLGVFLKVGAVLFGSGYVLLAFLRADLVERLGWLTERQLLDAVAVGQVTPGPVFTTATFVGYVLAGAPGAAAATIGIFLPAFVFVALSGPLVPRLRRSPTAGAVLDGVNVASLALMAVVTWQLGRAALIDPLTVGIAVAGAVLLMRYRVNSAWLVLGGAVVALAATAWPLHSG